MVSPEPNKRTSSVASDLGKAVAYVDDFEYARRTLSFGLSPQVWQHSSPFPDRNLWQDDTTAQLFRGRTYWFQYFVPDIDINDPYPTKARVQGRNNITALRVVFDPRSRGIYNKNPEFIDENNPSWNDPDSLDVRARVEQFRSANGQRIWGGMMLSLIHI